MALASFQGLSEPTEPSCLWVLGEPCHRVQQGPVKVAAGLSPGTGRDPSYGTLLVYRGLVEATQKYMSTIRSLEKTEGLGVVQPNSTRESVSPDSAGARRKEYTFVKVYPLIKPY